MSKTVWKWSERRRGEGWYCNTGISCFHDSLLAALWHNWKGWNDGDPTAPWERLYMFRAKGSYNTLRRFGVPRWEAARGAWRMSMIVGAHDGRATVRRADAGV